MWRELRKAEEEYKRDNPTTGRKIGLIANIAKTIMVAIARDATKTEHNIPTTGGEPTKRGSGEQEGEV